jgi:hypothetical protein
MNTKNRIKTLLTLAVVLGTFAAFGGSLQAATLVYEPFNYTPETMVNGTAVNAGTGLIGTWTGTNSINCRFVANSLPYGTLPVTGNQVRFHANSSPWAQASLDPTVMSGYLDDGDTLWFSVLGYNANTTNSNTIRFSLGGMTNGLGFIMDREDGSDTTVRIRADSWVGGTETIGTGSVTRPTATPTPDGTHMVVGKITFGATDTLDIYVPEKDLVLPAEPNSTVSADLDQSAFGIIRFKIANGNSLFGDEIRIGTSYESVGGVPLDPNLPSVNAGDDMITWSGQAVTMDPNVVNNDTNEPQGTLTYAWTAEPNGIGDPNLDVAITDADTENASVTITKTAPTGDATVVRMTLAVTLEGKDPVTDTMTIDVYDDACLAAKAVGLAVIDPTDFDKNCITNFTDFAVLAATWLDDYTLTEAVAK